MRLDRWCCLWPATVLCGCGAAGAAPPPALQFIGLTNFSAFSRAHTGQATVLTSPWLAGEGRWTELVVSWNALCPKGSYLKVEARGTDGPTTTPFYTLGLWSPDPTLHPRESVPGQRDALAEVKTDTLVCRRPMERVQVRLTLGGEPRPRLKLLGLCLLDSTAPPANPPPNRAAWGKVIAVPQRSQLDHPDGSGWCSPTCVSMILAHWANVLKRPELDVPVPEVAAAVHDRNWPGTGNWVFNTAFAGQFEGMRAYVSRLGSLTEIEDWIAAGIPVAASVSFDLLNGKARDEGTGHLIVVVGFTKTGDVVANDPWPAPKKENRVRKVFPRQNLIRAWGRSRGAVYLIHPDSVVPPPNHARHWMD